MPGPNSPWPYPRDPGSLQRYVLPRGIADVADNGQRLRRRLPTARACSPAQVRPHQEIQHLRLDPPVVHGPGPAAAHRPAAPWASPGWCWFSLIRARFSSTCAFGHMVSCLRGIWPAPGHNLWRRRRAVRWNGPGTRCRGSQGKSPGRRQCPGTAVLQLRGRGEPRRTRCCCDWSAPRECSIDASPRTSCACRAACRATSLVSRQSSK